MTGYLRALGSFAIGQTPALRPRPRSLFEPGNSPGEEAGWPGEIDVERMAPAPRPRTRRPAIQPVPTDIGPRPVAAAVPPEPVAMPTPAPVRLQPPVPVTEPASSAPDIPATSSPIGDHPRTGLPASRAAAPQALVEPPPSRPTDPAAAATSVPAVQARPEPVPAEPAPARERAIAPPAEESRQVVVERVVREVVRESRTETRPARDDAPVRPRPVAQVVAARAAVPAPQVAPPAPEPAPVIHVSVGRVEVRAVSPVPRWQPQPPAQPRVPAPALADYLAELGSHR